ncbi:hypothetical protein D3C72_1589160 [compost metagenome]
MPGLLGLVQLVDGIAPGLEHGLVARDAGLGRLCRHRRHVLRDAERGRCPTLQLDFKTPRFQDLVLGRGIQADPRAPAPPHGAVLVQRIQRPVVGQLVFRARAAGLGQAIAKAALERRRIRPDLLIQQSG